MDIDKISKIDQSFGQLRAALYDLIEGASFTPGQITAIKRSIRFHTDFAWDKIKDILREDNS